MQLTKDFQQILIDFFTKYDEKNLKTVPDIMKRFRQNKQQVILHLCNKYNVDINTLDGVDMTGEPQKPAAAVPIVEAGGKGETPVAETEEGAAAEGATAGEEAPKKKSKVVMIIIIVIVGLAVLGGGGYFAYDKFVGDGSADNEEVAQEEAAAEPVAEPEPAPEPEPA
ncbi:MAG TPA: hypothetical protein EYN71_06905, partial [Flavobacteriales bacterium]|nr:hypothetical protein [Flavobacteriales bacterium]